MLKKKLKSDGATITFVGLSPGLQRILRLMEFVHTLTNASDVDSGQLRSAARGVR